MKEKKNMRDILVWLIVVFLSANFIFIGGKYATKDVSIFNNQGIESCKARITKIIESNSSENKLGVNATYTEDTIKFKCKILNGNFKGEEVTVIQNINSMYGGSDKIKRAEKGDLILISKHTDSQSSINPKLPQSGWNFIDYYRFDKIMILSFVFALLVIILGRVKGINTLISLAFTTVFVFYVLLPWVLSGKNIYVGVAITCVFTIAMTLLIIEGASRKSLVTILSCCVGTLIAAAIPFIMNTFLHLSGLIDEHSFYLITLNPDKPIDLVGIVFAGIIIGALGAIMDVAMDISSSLYEITLHVPDISFRKLFKSGMSIGRDIMGTMANTLVLAYIGSSMCSVLLLFTYSSSIMELLNKEVVIVEMLQALAGSIALLLTIPFTVTIAGIIYLKLFKNNKPIISEEISEI